MSYYISDTMSISSDPWHPLEDVLKPIRAGDGVKPAETPRCP